MNLMAAAARHGARLVRLSTDLVFDGRPRRERGALRLGGYREDDPVSPVTVYGRLDVSLDNTKTGPDSLNQVRDNASRLGFRGTEDLGSGLKAAFGLEFGLSADTGTLTAPPFNSSSSPHT